MVHQDASVHRFIPYQHLAWASEAEQGKLLLVVAWDDLTFL